MKRFVLSTLVILCLSTMGYSQFEIGVKAGINSTELASTDLIFSDGNNDYRLQFQDAEYGVHFGLYTRVSFMGLYIEPAVLFNSTTVNFNLEEFSEDGPISTLRSETYRNVDIPLLVGTKLGFLRLQAGPVAHFYLDSASDLFSISGYKHNLKNATYGVQIGAGVDIWRFRFDALYETNFSKFGEHIEVNGEQHSFDDGADRVVLTLGVRF